VEFGVVLRGAEGDSLCIFVDDFPLVLRLRIERGTKRMLSIGADIELVPLTVAEYNAATGG
jgi:hypothetical protein